MCVTRAASTLLGLKIFMHQVGQESAPIKLELVTFAALRFIRLASVLAALLLLLGVLDGQLDLILRFFHLPDGRLAACLVRVVVMRLLGLARNYFSSLGSHCLCYGWL